MKFDAKQTAPVLIGQRLNEARESWESPHSHQTLADAVGMSRSAIRSIERGECSCRCNTLVAICVELSIDPRWALTGLGERDL
jgi:DNA-binding XRE family transcriptional regulator